MKYLLFSIAMVISSYCWGQLTYETAQPGYKSGKIIEFNPKQDTIKCLMLVCDTSIYGFNGIDTVEIVSGKILGTGFIAYYNSSVQWQFGYEVIEGARLYRIHQDGSRTPMFKVVEQLDQNKKPLPKSIVVWMTKEIKN